MCSCSCAAPQVAEQEQFLSCFYDEYIAWLAQPFLVPAATRTGRKETVFEKTAVRLACELLGFCIKSHSYRTKYFILRNSLISRILTRVLQYREKYLVLGACSAQQRMPAWCTLTPTAARCRLSAGIRFFRACVALKDDFYTRHITKYNLFAPVFEVFKRNGMRNNLLNSAIIELVEFVRHHQIVTLIDHIVEGFPELIEQVTYVSTFKALKEAYDRRLGAGASNSLDDRCVHACLPRAWIAGPWWSTVLTAAACDGLCGCDAMLPVRPPPTAVVVPWSMRRTARTGTTTIWL